jgi:uncharacterized membrane protein
MVWTAPLAGPAGARVVAAAYVAGAVVCHQRPERSFHVAGAQLPVCARCTALYSGAAIGMLGYLLTRGRRPRLIQPAPAVVWLAVTAVPAAVSVAGSISGVWDGTNVWRAAMSLPLGAAVGAVTAAVLAGDLR